MTDGQHRAFLRALTRERFAVTYPSTASGRSVYGPLTEEQAQGNLTALADAVGSGEYGWTAREAS